MIQVETVLDCGDNSGAKKLICIKVLSSKKRASIGDKIKVSVRDAVPGSKVKKGKVYNAVVIGTAKEKKRKDGSSIRFDTNIAVLIDKDDAPIGTRILVTAPRELRELGYMKIVSLAPEVA